MNESPSPHRSTVWQWSKEGSKILCRAQRRSSSFNNSSLQEFPKIILSQVIYNLKNNLITILTIAYFSLSHHPGNHVINYLRSLTGSQDQWNLFAVLNENRQLRNTSAQMIRLSKDENRVELYSVCLDGFCQFSPMVQGRKNIPSFNNFDF